MSHSRHRPDWGKTEPLMQHIIKKKKSETSQVGWVSVFAIQVMIYVRVRVFLMKLSTVEIVQPNVIFRSGFSYLNFHYSGGLRSKLGCDNLCSSLSKIPCIFSTTSSSTFSSIEETLTQNGRKMFCSFFFSLTIKQNMIHIDRLHWFIAPIGWKADYDGVENQQLQLHSITAQM